MSVWALSDPHLALSVPSKSMEVFGPKWRRYAERIRDGWHQKVGPEDLVLIPGDISWAKKLEEALIDLEWIDALPGTKVILKGNHDYWWPSSSKLVQSLPPSIHFIYNNAFQWQDIAIGGSRLWDTDEYNFNGYIEFQENPLSKEKEPHPEEDQKIFARELERLKLSLSQLDPKAKVRIALTHYPPIGADLKPSLTSNILESFNIQYCVFGHLHNVKPHSLPFGAARGVNYIFASCDYLDFIPVQVLNR